MNSIDEAIRSFEACPKFASVQVRMRERMEDLEGSAPAEAKALGSPARFEYAQQRFDVRAEAFLELVTDLHTQNAFIEVLDRFRRLAIEEYAGFPAENLRPMSDRSYDEWASLQTRMQTWITAGYRRVADQLEGQERQFGASSADMQLPAGVTEYPSAPGETVALQRFAAVDAYIEEVHQKTGGRITRANIWRKLGYKSRSSFEKWQRNDPNQSREFERRMDRLLTEKPHLENNLKKT